MSDSKYAAIGTVIGFIGFTISIALIGGVFIRPNEKGKKIFTLSGFFEFIKAPFRVGTPQFQSVWATQLPQTTPLKDRLKLWSMNWILWTGLGCASVILSKYIINMRL